MEESDVAQPRLRLLAATLAVHDAFADAAGVVTAPGYAAEFARRAEYFARVATQLRGEQAPTGLASDALRHQPEVRSGRTAASGDDNHRQLYSRCLGLMDAATMEFCRGYGPKVAQALSNAMLAAYPVNTTRHGATGWRLRLDWHWVSGQNRVE